MPSIEYRPDRPKRYRARYWGPDGKLHSRSFARKDDAQRWLTEALMTWSRVAGLPAPVVSVGSTPTASRPAETARRATCPVLLVRPDGYVAWGGPVGNVGSAIAELTGIPELIGV